MRKSYTELESYFTDADELREIFKKLLTATIPSKRILVIHGVGGVGKSSLLGMFYFYCQNSNVSIAIASGDEQNSPMEVINRWIEDLEANITFSKTKKTLQQYLTVKSKIDEQVKKIKPPNNIAGKVASKTAEAAGGALMGAAIGSVLPGFGTAIGSVLGGVLGGIGSEAIEGWLRGFLKQSDIDLLRDPTKQLTTDFITDISRIKDGQRLVLMIDTCEQMTALEEWECEVVQQLPKNVLFVIAGRAIPNWNQMWPGWMANAIVEELKPMTDADIRQLIQRYYATIRGGEPLPEQVDEIVLFARGLPMVATSAVRLWIEYGIEDFKAVKPGVVADLVDHLLEGVPDDLRDRIKAASTLRWFNRSLLGAIMDKNIFEKDYRELRLFPFMRSRVEGLALHDAVREIIDQYMKMHEPEQHRNLHERAATYFETQLKRATGEEAEWIELERLFHRICAHEESGIQLFQEMAEELLRYRFLNRLRALLNDIETYPLNRENSKLWKVYYNTRLLQLGGNNKAAREQYEYLISLKSVDTRLRAYVLSDLGEVLREARENEAAIPLLEESISIAQIDLKIVWAYHNLVGAYRRIFKYKEARKLLEEILSYCTQHGDRFGLLIALDRSESIYLAEGNAREAKRVRAQRLEILNSLNIAVPYIDLQIIGGNGFLRSLLTGNYHEIDLELKRMLVRAINLESINRIHIYRDLAFIAWSEGRFLDADNYLKEGRIICAKLDPFRMTTEIAIYEGFEGVFLMRQGFVEDAEVKFKRSLDIKTKTMDQLGIPELYFWLGELFEIKAISNNLPQENLILANNYYSECCSQIRAQQNRFNFLCGALIGLVRIKQAQGQYDAIPPLLTEAEQLAQRNEYYNYLASLRLTQGHIAFNNTFLPVKEEEPGGVEISSSSAFHFYQQALIYALRYNRFLVDEVLSGLPKGTPIRSIVSECLSHGNEGAKVLIALQKWWQEGVNDVGESRLETISPIPEGISLLNAECIMREREPGDGSPQSFVVDQIEVAVNKNKNLEF